jgi:hypothetical protein
MRNKYLNYLLIISTALLGLVTKVYSQDIPKELYIASTIPDSLREGANSVVRFSEIGQNVKGPGKVIITVHTLVTALNEKAADEAIMRLNYNKKFYTVSNIEMRIFDDKGNLIKKYNKGDMYDGARNNDETLVSDDRFLAVRHTIVSYPATIEQEYEVDKTSLLDLGGWEFQNNEQSVQHSYYNITINNNAGFRYLNKNTTIKPLVKTDADKSEYSWSVTNLKAIKIEEGAVEWRVFPHIYFASNSFEFYGLPGDFSTWKNYGKWQQALNSDICSLSPEREAEIRKLTDTIKTDKAKTKFLYNYLQHSMRYVNVQLGIGGLKPFPATFVDQKKYGDCKALSNYMSALLKAVNIRSYYTMINAETNGEPAELGFPWDPFNHIILCVPFKNDTTWLECTSNITAFGELGPSTENRTALLIKEDGGELVNTPKSSANNNQFNSEAHIVLDAEGGAKMQIKILSTGEYRDIYLSLGAEKIDEQKQYLLRDLDIKQPMSFDFASGRDMNGVKEVDLNLDYDKFCDIKSGDKLFYHPMAFTLWGNTVPVLEKRKTDYYFEFPRQKSCITTIDLPADFQVETLPANQSLKFTYGNYEVNYVYDPAKNQVVSTAKFILTNHVIPAAKYTELQQYLDGVAKAQNKKLVIRKKV